MNDRGRLLTAEQVIAKYFPHDVQDVRKITPRWVYQHVRPRVELARGVVRFYESDVEAWLDERRKAAGLPETTRLHDLRHSHGQWALDGGVAEALVQVSLRHTQASTTRRYTKQKGRADVATALAKTLTGEGA